MEERERMGIRADESARLHLRKARLGLTFDVKVRASFASYLSITTSITAITKLLTATILFGRVALGWSRMFSNMLTLPTSVWVHCCR
jgi:hypothetical protein